MTAADIIEANANWLRDVTVGCMFGMRCIIGRSMIDGFEYVVFWEANQHIAMLAGSVTEMVAAGIRYDLGIRQRRFDRTRIDAMLRGSPPPGAA